MSKLTKVQMAALECIPSEPGREVSNDFWRAGGVSSVTMQSLLAADMVGYATYSNGRYWRLTDLGRKALEGKE